MQVVQFRARTEDDQGNVMPFPDPIPQPSGEDWELAWVTKETNTQGDEEWIFVWQRRDD